MPESVRVLIPRVRRAIDGPTASGSAAPSTTLTDDEVEALAADAIADLILLTTGTFGVELQASGAVGPYGAPEHWQTEPEMSTSAQSVVVAQAAFDYFFETVKRQKTSETIKDEGQEWSYQLSATLVRDQLKYLKEERDAALAALNRSTNVVLDSYVSFIYERDRLASYYVEPYIAEIGSTGGVPVFDLS